MVADFFHFVGCRQFDIGNNSLFVLLISGLGENNFFRWSHKIRGYLNVVRIGCRSLSAILELNMQHSHFLMIKSFADVVPANVMWH